MLICLIGAGLHFWFYFLKMIVEIYMAENADDVDLLNFRNCFSLELFIQFLLSRAQ